MVSETPKPEKKETSLALPVAAAAAVALGTLGLVAWARSSQRRQRPKSAAPRSNAGKRQQGAHAPRETEPAAAQGASTMPEGTGGEVREIGAHVIVTDPFGPGARARVYRRGDWVAAVMGEALPEPAYEVSRRSAEAAQLSAMAYVRAAQREQES